MNDTLKEFKGLAGRAAAWTAGVLFPPVCAGCRRHVTQPGTLCGACWPKLKFLEKPWCPVMGTPFVHEMGEGFLSAEAIANPPPFARARAAVAYSASRGTKRIALECQIFALGCQFAQGRDKAIVTAL